MNKPTTSPEVIICENDAAAASQVAELFAASIRSNPGLVLGLATGGTPINVYRDWVQRHRDGNLSFTEATSFNLDEYVGLDSDHPQSFRYFMQHQLFKYVDFELSRVHVPDGTASDLERQASDYEQQIRDSGGIDLQLLGIGNNGHIAFNEPGSPFESRTRVVDLTEDTIRANARFFDSIDQVPRHAVTMGIGTILEARKIVLMATGESKAEAVADAIEGDCDEHNPASALQRHPNVVFVLDPPAASCLDG